MGISNLESRIVKLENTAKTEFGTPVSAVFFPVRKLMLAEERSHDEDGVAFPVLVATWDRPAGVLLPDSIRLIHNDTTVSLPGTATSYRMPGYLIGDTITVNVTAMYLQGASSTVTAVKTITGDATPPSVPTNLTVTGGFRTLTLRWENPTTEDFSHVEIWESVIGPDVATSERIAQAYGTEFVRSNCGVLEVRWYWIRALDVNGNFSDFTSVASGTTTAIAMEDVPDGTITESMLISELASEINKIPAIEEDVNLINTIDLPAYEQRIANRIDEINDGIMTQVNTYADGTIDAMLDASEAISAVRDAGIITDPATGLTSIFALDAYKTANDARVSTVEIDLNAVEGTLVEKASVVEVDALSGRIGTAESRLDGHDSEIALLATSQELDAVESRVSIAEVNIDALEGSIVNKVVSAVTVTQDEEELIAQGLVDAMLNDREAQTDAKAKTQSALAIAESELYAHINDEMEAEAGQRLLLAAKVDNNQAAIQTEATVRSSADSAMASQITTLQATAGNNTAAIQIVEDVRTGEVNVFRQASAPTTGMITGDLWINNTEVVHRYEGGQWVSKEGTPVYDLLKTAIAQYVVKTQTVTGDGQLKVAGFGLYNDSTTGSEFAVLADKFYVYGQKSDGSSYSNIQVFTVDTTTTPPTVGINGNLIVDGSIAGEKIFSGAKIQLGDGGEFVTGANSIVQMASGVILLDSVNGVIQVKDPENVTTGDYVKIDTGDITTYKYLGGAYYPMKSLRKMATGSNVPNNTAVIIPSRFPSQPEIFVSPCNLQTYDASPYGNQDQSLFLQATDINYNPTTGVCTFVPRAELRIAAGSGNLGVISSNSTSTGVATITQYPDVIRFSPVSVALGSKTIPANVSTVSINAKIYAQAMHNASHGTTYGYCLVPHVIDYVIYAKIDGTDYVVGSGAINRQTSLIAVSSEPTALYINKNITLTVNTVTSKTIIIWAYIAPRDGSMYDITSYALGYEDNPISVTPYNKAWLACSGISYVLASANVIATGTLNYIAIAE